MARLLASVVLCASGDVCAGGDVSFGRGDGMVLLLGKKRLGDAVWDVNDMVRVRSEKIGNEEKLRERECWWFLLGTAR